MAKQGGKREHTHECYTQWKYEKVESINTQNDYETVSKNWTDKKKKTYSVCFVEMFKFQEN